MPSIESYRYFLSYSGVALPLRLITPIAENDIRNRNTYVRAWFDIEGRLVGCEKLVYGEIEMAHIYEYHANGTLRHARISLADEENTIMEFDETGRRIV